MKKSFLEYERKTRKAIKDVQQTFLKSDIEYVPQLQMIKTQILIDSPKKRQEANKDFFNMENVYLRIVSLMKQFLLSEQKDFTKYLKWHIQIKILNKLFTKIQLQKNKCPQFHTFLYLIWANSKKMIRTYIKYREQILQRCAFDKTKNDPICLHNKAKYIKQPTFIGQIEVEFQICQFMIKFFKSEIPIQMIEWLGQSKKSVNSLKLFHVFLWQSQNKEFVHRLSSEMEHQN